VSKPLQIALAGAGFVSRHHLIAWSKLPQARVVAVADPDRAKAEERARTFRIPDVFDDATAMLDAVKPDAIDIATPVDTHADLVRVAVSRGVAILCQKPVTPTLAEAHALRAEIGERVPLMVHENWRFRDPYRLARRWILDGRIGRVRRFSVSAESSGLIPPPGGGPPPGLVRQPFLADLPRLILFELLIHHLDVARALCGDLRVAAALTGRASDLVQGEDHAAVLLEGPGVLGTVTGDFAVPGQPPITRDHVEVVGDRGRIAFDGVTLSCWSAAGELHQQRFEPDAVYQSGYDAAIGHFVGCLATGEPFETSLEDNLKTYRLVEDAYAVAPAPVARGAP
jgi:predicted dehydrogenase